MLRIQLDLPEDQVAELDELMRETRIGTRKELFNNALTLFQWAVRARKSDRFVASVDHRGTVRELMMPAIENVKPAVNQLASSRVAAGD